MGFRPIGTTDGADYHGKIREAVIASGVANTFLGDMMTLSGTGSVDGRAEGVALATAGDGDQGAVSTTNLAGPIVGFSPNFNDEGTLIRNYHATGAAQRAQIVYGTDVIHEAPALSALAVTDIGGNRNIALGAGGNVVTGYSTHGIGAAPSDATEGQVRIIGASRTEDNQTITAVGAIWRCRINASVDAHFADGA